MKTSLSYTLDAADINKFAESQTPAAGGAQALTLTSTLTNTDAQHVSVSCAGADGARSFAFVGTDYNGNSITETLAGSSGSITIGTKNFASVVSITVDDDTAGAVQCGVAAAGESQWIPLNWRGGDISVQCTITGTPGYGVELTNDDVQASTFVEGGATAVAHSTLATETTNQMGIISPVPRAARLALTAAGAVEITLLQQDSG